MDKNGGTTIAIQCNEKKKKKEFIPGNYVHTVKAAASL